MDLLSLFAGCGLFVAAPCANQPVDTSPVQRWQPFVSQAAAQFALPEAWVRAVLKQESGGRLTLNGRPITSKAGAMGLMQIMPKTYSDLRRQYDLGADPHAPRDNILAGAAYLRQMYTRYGYPGLFAAYNAGPGRLDAYLAGRKPLPDETVAYLSAISPGLETRFSTPGMPPVKAAKAPAKEEIFISNSLPTSLFIPLSQGRF